MTKWQSQLGSGPKSTGTQCLAITGIWRSPAKKETAYRFVARTCRALVVCLVSANPGVRKCRGAGCSPLPTRLSYLSAFRSVEGELFPTAKGKFYAELTQVSMNKLWVHSRSRRSAASLHRCGQAASNRDRLSYAGLNQPAMQHCGMAVLPGDIIINDTDLMYRRTEANCDWGSMSLPQDDLDAACQAVTGSRLCGVVPETSRQASSRPDVAAA